MLKIIKSCHEKILLRFMYITGLWSLLSWQDQIKIKLNLLEYLEYLFGVFILY